MFWKKTPAQINLQKQIDAAEMLLNSHDVLSPEHDKIIIQIKKLYELQSANKTGFKVSPDAMVAALASIGGILIIVNYEHVHVLASKAISFVPKVKN